MKNFYPHEPAYFDLRREVKPHDHGADEDLRHLQERV